MSGERCRDANLPFEPSMRRGGSGIAIMDAQLLIVAKPFWQNEAKMINVFQEGAPDGPGASRGALIAAAVAQVRDEVE